jgi:hypothetical protein
MKKHIVPYGSEEQIRLVNQGWITHHIEEIINEITGQKVKMAVMVWNAERKLKV